MISTVSLLALAASLGPASLAAGSGDLAGIPAARSVQQWGSAVMEILHTQIRIEPIRSDDLAFATDTIAGAAVGPSTCCTSVVLVLALKLVSPLYTAVML